MPRFCCSSVLTRKICTLSISFEEEPAVALAVAGLATLRPKALASNMRGRAFLRRFQRHSRLP